MPKDEITAIATITPEQEALQRAQDFMPVMTMDVAIQRYEAIQQFADTFLKEGIDYGTIPGTKKPTLYKTGAEKTCTFFGFTTRFEEISKVEDWTGKDHGGEPLFSYTYRCTLLKNGRPLGEGVGQCSTWESKYRFRWVPESEVLPSLDKTKLQRRDGSISEPQFAVTKGQTTGQYGKPAEHWKMFRDAMSSGRAIIEHRPKKDSKETMAWVVIPSILFRVPNPDVSDQINTVIKMSQKRALLAATLITCNMSERFTQDMEDIPRESASVEPPKAGSDGPMIPEVVSHPGSSSAQADVVERKLKESGMPATQAKAEADKHPGRASQGLRDAVQQSAKPIKSDPPQQQQEIPPEVIDILARMSSTDRYEKLKVFQGLKKDFYEIAGDESGEAYYRQELYAFGVKKSDEFKRLSDAKQCAVNMWKRLQAVKAELERPRDPHLISDDDLPEGLFGNPVTDHGVYGVD